MKKLYRCGFAIGLIMILFSVLSAVTFIYNLIEGRIPTIPGIFITITGVCIIKASGDIKSMSKRGVSDAEKYHERILFILYLLRNALLFLIALNVVTMIISHVRDMVSGELIITGIIAILVGLSLLLYVLKVLKGYYSDKEAVSNRKNINFTTITGFLTAFLYLISFFLYDISIHSFCNCMR